MSNKTTFKRVALAVVAVLGFGVLASAPSSAAVIGLTVTTTDGTATTIKSDSTTAGTLAISYTSNERLDSVSVTAFIASRPTGASGETQLTLMWVDTATSTVNPGVFVYNVGRPSGVDSAVATSSARAYGGSTAFISGDSTVVVAQPGTTAAQIAAKFRVFFNGVTPSLTAGTYVIRTIVAPFNAGVAAPAASSVIKDISMVVSATADELATASKVVDPTKSIATLSTSANYAAGVNTPDSALAFISTASATDHATILVRTFNSKDVATAESVTATISGAGVLCNTRTTTVCGASLSLLGNSGVETLTVRANGVAGIAKIDVKTTSKTFATKSLTFFATNPATYEASLDKPVVRAGITTPDVVSIAATDANGNVWGGTNLYLYSSDTTVASNSTCTFNATDSVHYCSVAGVKAGETKWTIGNKDTLALSTVQSAEFAGPRVTAGAAASVKIEFDKAAYAPGEKARIYVTPLDAAGLTLPGETATSVFATGGITANVAFSSGSDVNLSDVTVVTDAVASATTGAKAGSAMYTVYMPFGKGTVTLTAKGGAGLPVAGQVAVTASAEVVDDSVDAAVDAAQEATDAAIAATDAAILAQEAADEAASAAIAAQETAQAAVDAVTALSAEVTKLVAQLATVQKLVRRVAKKVGVKL